MESSIYWSKARGVDLCRFATLPHCILSNLAKPLPHQDRWFPFASPGLRQRKTTQTQSFASPIYLRLFKPLKPWVFLRNFMCNQRLYPICIPGISANQSWWRFLFHPFSSFFLYEDILGFASATISQLEASKHISSWTSRLQGYWPQNSLGVSESGLYHQNCNANPFPPNTKRPSLPPINKHLR